MNQVSVHPRDRIRCWNPIIIPSHVLVNHQQNLTYTKVGLQYWVVTIVLHTEKGVHFFLESIKVPEQGFKFCVSLIKDARRYKKERIEEVCKGQALFTPPKG